MVIPIDFIRLEFLRESLPVEGGQMKASATVVLSFIEKEAGLQNKIRRSTLR